MWSSRLSINIGVILVLLVFPAILGAVKGPELVFEKTAYDFGDVHVGDVVETQFSVFNRGDAFLNIDDVRTSCGCTKATVVNPEIRPGQGTGISVSYDSSGQRPGKKTQTVFVHSNDSKNPVARLQIFANITQ